MKKALSPVQKVLLWGGVVLLLIMAVAFIFDNMSKTQQAGNPMFPKVRFEGQYQIADGSWQPITPGEHISAVMGDVTLQGDFRLISPDTGEDMGPAPVGIPVALYCNHVQLQIAEGDGPAWMCDPENPVFGDDACADFWSGYYRQTEEEVTITIHNPHLFGNVLAVDQLLGNMSVYADYLFEESIREQGSFDRSLAVLFLVSASILLGIALFLLMVHVRNSRELFFIGMMTLFAGTYFLFDATGVSFWNNSNVMNTTMKGLSMMFYMLSVDVLIVSLLDSFSGKLGLVSVVTLGVAEIVIIGIPLFTDIYFYDLWLVWAGLQTVVGIILLSCLLYGAHQTQSSVERALFISVMLPVITFLLDAVATALGWWQGGVLSKIMFLILYAVIVFLVMRVIPDNINAAVRAQELETEQKVLQAELQRSRVATMMSQIQPHFIYNTLSSIEQLCTDQPKVAAGLVHSFSEYLQGNFRQVDDVAPILFSREIEHVRHYTEIEQVRFADMTILYDLQAVEFMIPALTVQPLVENAIKHGLMGLEEGGTVLIRAEETPTHYCVSVVDDGIGFDVNALGQDNRHIGIRNIQGRLKAICNGSLTIESTPGKGTTAKILIPKQEK